MTATKELEDFLAERIGLDAASIGAQRLAGALQASLANREPTDISSYLQLLRHDERELQALIDRIVVPESWFFRDRQPFERFQRFLKEEAQASSNSPLQVLTIPCAGGEEAYSLAICLLEAGLSPADFKLVAVDVSDASLERARRGVFGPASFRGEELGARSRFFSVQNKSREVIPEVRAAVHFVQGNLIDSESLTDLGPFHVIFCRNLLIYFTAEARKQALDRLDRLLRPGGLLFVGHAETLAAFRERFLVDPDLRSFAYRKPEVGAEAVAVNQVSNAFRRPMPASPVKLGAEPRLESIQRQSAAQRPTLPASSRKSEQADLYEQAVQLANRKEHREAALRCEELLKERCRDFSSRDTSMMLPSQ